jgi:hypothetical protein
MRDRDLYGLRKQHTVLAILKHALTLTHDVVVDGPFVDDAAAEDQCCLLAATDRLLCRYREALAAIDHDFRTFPRDPTNTPARSSRAREPRASSPPARRRVVEP